MADKKNGLSIYLSYLLRHHPEDVGLDMDGHGWVSVDQLIERVNAAGRHALDRPALERIVRTDAKGRYRFSEDMRFIKCCQGHSIPWVEPELTLGDPPDVLYHGTTMAAWRAITASGAISKMRRHAVHIHADRAMAAASARRWHAEPVVLAIDARRMSQDGFVFGESENHVWCVDRVPVEYILSAEEV